MKSLIISGNNLVANNPYNNIFQYNFPSGAVELKDYEVAMTSLSIYYSWPNISSSSTGAQYNNNSFSYIWIDGTKITVTMPDGFYNGATDLNSYLQNVMTTNGHYLINAQNSFIYYLEIVVNVNYYAIQLNCYNVPTSAEASSLSYTQPSNATWSFPSVSTCPQFVISSTNNFGSVIGFSGGTYPSSVVTGTSYSVLSNNGVPNITPINSVVVECSLINNSFTIPNQLLYSFSPNTTYGSQVQINVPAYTYLEVVSGRYQNFNITLKDQDLNPIYLQDTNLVIMLSLRKTSETNSKI